MSLLAIVFTACSDDDDYQWATAEGSQVYFSQSLPSLQEVSDDATTFSVPVNRINKSGAITVPVAIEDLDTVGGLSADPSVTFADGDSVAYVKVTYDPSKLTFDELYGVKLSISGDGYVTPYGASDYTFSLKRPSPFKSLGTGYYADGFMFDGYEEVEIMQSKIDPTIFRVMDPYNATFMKTKEMTTDGNQAPYMEFKVTKAGDVVDGVTLTQDGLVFFSDTNTGYYYGDGYGDVTLLHPDAMSGMNTEANWIYNYVAAWQEDGTPGQVILSPYYYLPDYGGGWNQTNGQTVEIIMPGFTPSDYSCDAEYVGRFTDTKDADFALVNVTLGADVAKALVAAVPASVSEDAAVNGILDSTYASVEVTESGQVQVPYTESGKYNIYIITFDADGNPQSYGFLPVTLYSGSDSKETFEEVANGVLTLGAKDLSSNFSDDGSAWGLLLESFPATQEATLSRSTKDPTHYQIAPYLKDGYPLDFHVDADGYITVDGIETGYTVGDNGNLLATDLVTKLGSEDLKKANLAARYDASTGTYYFDLAYNGSVKGWYAIEEETFVVDEEAKACGPLLSGYKKLSATAHSLKTKFKSHSVKALLK